MERWRKTVCAPPLPRSNAITGRLLPTWGQAEPRGRKRVDATISGSITKEVVGIHVLLMRNRQNSRA
jgi:hypothetical protein